MKTKKKKIPVKKKHVRGTVEGKTKFCFYLPFWITRKLRSETRQSQFITEILTKQTDWRTTGDSEQFALAQKEYITIWLPDNLATKIRRAKLGKRQSQFIAHVIQERTQWKPRRRD